MNKSLELSSCIFGQAMHRMEPPTVTDSYHRHHLTDGALKVSINADTGHVACVVIGSPELREALVKKFAERHPQGFSVRTAFGPVSAVLGADPSGNRFAIGRWSFRVAKIRFGQEQQVEKAVARGLLMVEIAKEVLDVVGEVLAAAPDQALAA